MPRTKKNELTGYVNVKELLGPILEFTSNEMGIFCNFVHENRGQMHLTPDRSREFSNFCGKVRDLKNQYEYFDFSKAQGGKEIVGKASKKVGLKRDPIPGKKEEESEEPKTTDK